MANKKKKKQILKQSQAESKNSTPDLSDPATRKKGLLYNFKVTEEMLQEPPRLYFYIRLKAFIIDIFMIYTPILYISYFILGADSSDFRTSQPIIFACNLIYALVYAYLLERCGQTPGLRAYELKLVRDRPMKDGVKDPSDGANVSFLIGFARFYLSMISFALIVPAIIAIYRRDKKPLYDVLLKTRMIKLSADS